MASFNGEASNSNAAVGGHKNGYGDSDVRPLKIANIINDPMSPKALHTVDVFGPKGLYQGVSRDEITRTLIQTLGDIGHQDLADRLAEESNCKLESDMAKTLRQSILGGDWNQAEIMIKNAVFKDPKVVDGILGLLQTGTDKRFLLFQIKRQKYYELLLSKQTPLALSVLRDELAPLIPSHSTQENEDLPSLTSLLMCGSEDEIIEKGGLSDTIECARQELWDDISCCLAPEAMLPNNRLGNAIYDMTQAQLTRCLYHSTPMKPSLIQSHRCLEKDFPSEIALTLTPFSTEPGEEAWQIKFSNHGEYLAVCGNRGHLTVFRTSDFALVWSSVYMHGAAITTASWSPDDSKIVTCSMDRTVRVYDFATKTSIKLIEVFEYEVTGCVWDPSGSWFIISSMQEKGLIKFSSVGELMTVYDLETRWEDMVLIEDRNCLVLLDSNKELFLYDHLEGKKIKQYSGIPSPVSLAAHPTGDIVYVNTENGQVLGINLETGKTMVTCLGHKYDESILRVSCGGANDMYVISGSADGTLHVWHRKTGSEVRRLVGHTKGVSAGMFNPVNPRMIASCSDDGTVKIWTNKTDARKLRSENHKAMRGGGGSDGSSSGMAVNNNGSVTGGRVGGGGLMRLR